MLGVAFFGINLLLYAKALKTIPVAIAYPIMIGTTMSALTILGVLIFGERLAIRDLCGLVFVAGGIALFARAI